jgi:hypothetical protein
LLFSMDKNKRKKTSRAIAAVPAPIMTGVEVPVNSAQLAKHLQVTTRTLANYREQGLIPYWKLNCRQFRYRISAVEMALANAR